jgi:hypothetical protein
MAKLKFKRVYLGNSIHNEGLAIPEDGTLVRILGSNRPGNAAGTFHFTLRVFDVEIIDERKQPAATS